MPAPLARPLLAVLLLVLFVGTLMPGQWKESATRPFEAAFDLAAWAHVGLFALITWVVHFAEPRRIRPRQLPLLGLALALLTEGLQFFAINRHPNVAGVVQDLAGTLIGWALVLAAVRYRRVAQRS